MEPYSINWPVYLYCEYKDLKYDNLLAFYYIPSFFFNALIVVLIQILLVCIIFPCVLF